MKKILFSLMSLALSASVYSADGRGKISNLFFSGGAFSAHTNVVQFNLEGGFSRVGCSQQYAAVRAEDTHLVSALLAAKMSDSVVEVILNPADYYYNVPGNEPNRCVVVAVAIP